MNCDTVSKGVSIVWKHWNFYLEGIRLVLNVDLYGRDLINYNPKNKFTERTLTVMYKSTLCFWFFFDRMKTTTIQDFSNLDVYVLDTIVDQS